MSLFPLLLDPEETCLSAMEKLLPLCFVVDTATGKRGQKIFDLSDLLQLLV